MAQAMLDYLGVPGGLSIELNNSKEEFKTVASGQTIKAGDFVVFDASGNVSVATTTPFDGLALTDGSSGGKVKVAMPNV